MANAAPYGHATDGHWTAAQTQVLRATRHRAPTDLDQPVRSRTEVRVTDDALSVVLHCERIAG
jgi:hypothetical protein